MKSDYEKIIESPYVSWSFLYRELEMEIPFQWHHHPEYELTLTLNSYGVKYIGSDVEKYQSDDLVLIGPNVSHSWKSQGKLDDHKPHLALVIWFSTAWIEKVIETFPEMKSVSDFLKRISTAVTFSDSLIRKIKPDIIAISELDSSRRTPLLLSVLLNLLDDKGMKFSHSLQHGASNDEKKKVRKILEVIDYLNKNYNQKITIEEMSGMCHVSQTTFHRLFRKISKKSPLDYIINLRIIHASERLLETQDAVSNIASDVGYSSLALFNRHFKSFKGMSPREYRELYCKYD